MSQDLLHSSDVDSDAEPPPSILLEASPLETNGDGRHFDPVLDIKQKTLYEYLNCNDLDKFFQQVYAYYCGRGFYPTLLAKLFDILTFSFVTSMTTFLLGCIDYSKIKEHGKLSDATIEGCLYKLPFFQLSFMILSILFTLWLLFRFIYEVSELRLIRNFYNCLLIISDQDVATTMWHQIVTKITNLSSILPPATRQSHAALHKINAHDIANRIMRQENYFIGLINKDLLDLRVTLPLVRNRLQLSKILEWNISFAVLHFIFDGSTIRKEVLREANRAQLADNLRNRFIFLGFLNIIFAPFIALFLLIYFILRYGEEFHSYPGSIGQRQYTHYAKWKFREFNELPHVFETRLKKSYTSASDYVSQFPTELTAVLARFLSFISGSFVVILTCLTFLNQDFLLGFELTPGMSVFFYIGVFGTLFAISRSMIPDENLIYDPRDILKQVIKHTHYLPEDWKSRLHTAQVRSEFGLLFENKSMLFIQEILGVIISPFLLWFSLPPCSENIIDFFREFTVHVDNVGYVCSFAVFDFAHHGNVQYGAPQPTNEFQATRHGKMEKSFLHFKDQYPDWNPEQEKGSLYLSHMMDKRKKQTQSIMEQSHLQELKGPNVELIPFEQSMLQSRILGRRAEEIEDVRLVDLLNDLYDVGNV